ncbi:MAG: hypothetical protein WBX25_05020 [Rhodomicrobium sp.]
MTEQTVNASGVEELQDFHNPLRALGLVVAAVDHRQQVMPMALHHVLEEPVSFELVKAEEVLERLKDSVEPLPQYITSRGKAPYLDYSKFTSVGALASCLLASMRDLEKLHMQYLRAWRPNKARPN